MNETVCIRQRFAGPPEVGNGGYVSGLLAQHIDGPAEITLRRPTPLEYPLTVEHAVEKGLVLRNGYLVVAEAQSATLELDVPEPPTFQETLTSREKYVGFKTHPYPHCFVCGPQRAHADGLRIFPGPMAGRQLVVAPWIPDESLADETGAIRPEFLWAALDCPGAIAIFGSQPRPILLGRLTATIKTRIQPGQRCVVIGWTIARDGCKHMAGTALFSETGELVGKAKAIWIEPKVNTH